MPSTVGPSPHTVDACSTEPSSPGSAQPTSAANSAHRTSPERPISTRTIHEPRRFATTICAAMVAAQFVGRRTQTTARRRGEPPLLQILEALAVGGELPEQRRDREALAEPLAIGLEPLDHLGQPDGVGV